MAIPIFPDPMQMWREAIDKMEKEANAIGTASLKSPELVRSMQQGSATMLGLQQAFEKVAEEYLRRVNLPSRTELLSMGESLQRIEQKLDLLLLRADGQGHRPRPARTRKPATATTVPASEAEPEKEVKPRPAKRTVAKRTVAKKTGTGKRTVRAAKTASTRARKA